jgi:hypothetical protein
MNLVIFITSYFLIIFSVIGYGLLFNYSVAKRLNLNIQYNLLGAVFFLISVSYLTHFFFKHGYFHNLIIFIIGIFSFFFYSYRNRLSKKILLTLIIIFLILLFSYFSAKPHDDFPYYHFPYTYYLNQSELIIGIGNLNHGFRTPSSIFYLNSLFYLPFIKYNSFHISSIIFLGLANLILIFKLNKRYRKKNFDYIFFLTLLSFLFINIFFYRISEHGTDRSAQIFILILFIETLSLCKDRESYNTRLTNIVILLGIIISLKAFYVLYILILVPILYIIKKNNLDLKKIIINLFGNIYFYIFFSLSILLILTNLFNTGCILYPIKFLCFNYFEWSLIDQAQQMNNWYELWSKAGAGPNFRIENPEQYIQKFNWLSNWVDKYFFNKVFDFFLGLIFLNLVVFFTFYSQSYKDIKIIDTKIVSIILLIILLIFEWFYNHPSLRYGGYSLFALILFIPFSIILSSIVTKKNIKKKILSLIMISILIFVGRNISRLNNEFKQYNYSFENPYYRLEDSNFRIDSLISNAKIKYLKCISKNIDICKYLESYQIYMKNNYFLIKLIDN